MMQSTERMASSRAQLWTGRVLSGLVVVFLLFASALPKLIGHASAYESWERFGYAPEVNLTIGILEALLAILYAIPRTSVLGAIILTGFLGGAAATQFRIGDPWYIFPIAVGVLAWLGLALREKRLFTMVPLRQTDTG